ncbi:DUF5007 domain-containing protein [Chitinophagaceae bacterium LB-8]|uniref:DUF5007 domain-containing protein n=1 Tax=Paraflavisolibacter caeni TaxID=2982496 RepID=A0A9X2XVB3_9BACT|nr:DUF5007 domain-containing protein [Paraflavisolibacter caeni]MCU7549415.1 DUF5007 domain-containing protein [Paraflavisolibacter caeni]
MNSSIKNIPGIAMSLLCAGTVLLLSSCQKFLPAERETVGSDSQYTTDVYQPILGRTTNYTNNFYQGSTTYPSTFRVVNPRRRNGQPAPELTDVFPVLVWKTAYTGLEKSVEEIDAKREIQNRPLFEIGEHSGSFTMWAAAKSSFMRAQPDSGYLFDVELSNSGGRRYFRNLKLQPMRERPYEPSNYNASTGQPTSNGVTPSVVSSIKGLTTDRYLSYGDIEVYIRKVIKQGVTPTNSLTFRFLDTLYNPIDPAKFATTDWDNLVHGFNKVMTNESVTYKVAYPIPAVALPTRFTTGDGKRAKVRFSYSRLGFGGATEKATLGLDFAIYEPGDWEIVFAFKSDNPKFVND